MPAPDPAHYSDCMVSPKWIRGLFNGRFIVDSRRALLARRAGRPPIYYFPHDDIDMQVLRESRADHPDERTRYLDIRVGERRATQAAWEHLEAIPNAPQLSGHIAFDWSSLDAWFEEDEEVFVHPRDPYVRVDTLHSSRHIRIVVDGETVADSHSPVLLFETGLPTRYYLPRSHVKQDRLIISERVTHCPYKGEAHYYSLQLPERQVQDLIWYYRYPTQEASAVAGRVCFYTEKVDALYIDGLAVTT